MSRVRHGLRKHLKNLSLHLRLILSPKADYNIKKQNQHQKQKPDNSGEGGECDFQSYHTIRFTSPVFH